MTKLLFSALSGALALAISSTASAQVDKSEWQTEGGYHIFKDDPLTALGEKAGDMRIRVRPNATRTYLLRARTSFVPEMFKSVEKM